jgi:hypothetical protein
MRYQLEETQLVNSSVFLFTCNTTFIFFFQIPLINERQMGAENSWILQYYVECKCKQT